MASSLASRGWQWRVDGGRRNREGQKKPAAGNITGPFGNQKGMDGSFLSILSDPLVQTQHDSVCATLKTSSNTNARLGLASACRKGDCNRFPISGPFPPNLLATLRLLGGALLQKPLPALCGRRRSGGRRPAGAAQKRGPLSDLGKQKAGSGSQVESWDRAVEAVLHSKVH